MRKMRWLDPFRGLFLACALLALAGGRAAADVGDVFYVDQGNISGVEDGLSWETAATTLEEGIEIARRNFGGEVWVAAGIYDEPRSEDGSLRMRASVELYGGFTGTEGARNQRDWRQHLTIIEGAFANNGAPAEHVVMGANNSRLDGFLIRGGRGENGAGMLNASVSPVIVNCTFTGNEALLFGGAMLNVDGAMPRIENCRFVGNLAGESGGAIANAAASPYIERSTFQNNIAEFAAGAIFNTPESDPLITQCVFRENFAGDGGGGAIFNDAAAPLIEKSHFFDNHTEAFGGAIFFNDTETLLVNNVFARNQAPNQRGGALAILNSSLYIVNCTFTANRASGQGGAMFSSDAQVNIVNSILWNDIPNEFARANTSLKVTYTNISAQLSGEGNINYPPRFRDPANDDFSLLPHSLSINAGTVDGAPDSDIRNVPRPQGDGVDIGAYEYTEAPLPEDRWPLGCQLFALGTGPGGSPGIPAPGDLLVLGLLLGVLLVAARRRPGWNRHRTAEA